MYQTRDSVNNALYVKAILEHLLDATRETRVDPLMGGHSYPLVVSFMSLNNLLCVTLSKAFAK